MIEDTLKMEMCFNCNKKLAALPHECHRACEKYDICDDCTDNCLL